MSNFTAQPVKFGSKIESDAQVQIAPHQPDVVGLRIDPSAKGVQTADLVQIFDVAGNEIFTVEADGTVLITDLVVAGSATSEMSAISIDVTTLDVYGKAYFSDGTSALPGITFESDPDTGIFRQGSGIIVLTNNGASGMTIDASKNVVIAGSVTAGSFIGTVPAQSFADGTSALPGLAFTSDVDTGIFRQGSGIVVITNNGASGVTVDASKNMVVAGSVTANSFVGTIPAQSFADGTSAVPGIAFTSDPDTGLFRQDSGIIVLTNNGASGVTVDANKNMVVAGSVTANSFAGTIPAPSFADGTSALPSIAFTSDPDTGIFRQGSGIVVITNNAASGMTLDASKNMVVAGSVTANSFVGTLPAFSDGTSALPGIAFTNDIDTGIFRQGSGIVVITNNGASGVTVDASKNVVVGGSITSPSLSTGLLTITTSADLPYAEIDDLVIGGTLNISDILSIMTLSATTTNGVLTEMFSSPGGSRLTVPTGKVWAFSTLICGRVTDAGITTVGIASGGADYTDGDILSLTLDGGTGFLCTSDSVSPVGAVTGVTVTACGNGYTTLTSGMASGGTGTNCILTASTHVQEVGEAGAYVVGGVIGRIGNATSLIGSVTQTILAESDDKWNATAAADDTNDALVVSVSGQSGVTASWTATIQIVEV